MIQLFQGTSDLQLERINVYYNEATGGKYVPRYCFRLKSLKYSFSYYDNEMMTFDSI